MSLGIKSPYEERKLEFMRDDVYCTLMVSEVIEFLPRYGWSTDVVEISRKLGREITCDDVRETKQGTQRNRWAAYCINLYGKTLINGKKKTFDLTQYRPKL